MIGTFINTAAVVVGTGVGLTARRFLKPRLRETTMQIIGLMTLMIGVQMSLSEKNPLLPLASLLLGAIIGEGLDIEAKLDALGNALQQRFSNEGGSTFSQAFVSTSILFCVGPMTIMGCIQDGLTGNYSLLLVKSLLDAVDGSLARARQRPSRVGRFLDSLLDFALNAAVYLAIAWPWARTTGSPQPLALALAALLSATWQGSAFNYYSVAYRLRVGGESTSRLDESGEDGMPWDDPRALRLLLALYALVYGWQDRLMAALDRWVTPGQPPGAYTDRRFLTAVTAMGLGTQLAIIALCSWIGRPLWALYAFVGPFNVYFVGLMAYRYTRYRQA